MTPPPLALTGGDPAGIGPEITLAAWRALRTELAFALIADADALAPLAAAAEVPLARIGSMSEAAEAMPHAMPVLHQGLAAPPVPGRADPANAAAVIAMIDCAVAAAQAGEAAGVVTNPIAKKVLVDGAGFAHPGHTEYLGHLTGVDRTVMMLVAPELRVVPVTIHVPLAEVPRRLTPALLEETLRLTHAALRRDFGLPAPRLAVAGLNPHAGEGGLMGREDADIIAPVLSRLREEGLEMSGPLPADTMFHAAARAGYDAAVCMYHDQALIPVKTLAFDHGVNMTLGLPFVRTSPDHGTAFGIAGTGRASPDSLIAALRLAAEVAARRRAA